MNREDINLRLLGIIRETLLLSDDIQIKDTFDLRKDIGFDSLDFLDLVLKTETVFNIKITPAEAARCVIVSDFVNLIESKIK